MEEMKMETMNETVEDTTITTVDDIDYTPEETETTGITPAGLAIGALIVGGLIYAARAVKNQIKNDAGSAVQKWKERPKKVKGSSENENVVDVESTEEVKETDKKEEKKD